MSLNIVIIDDEFLAVSHFLKMIADDTNVNCKHFWKMPEKLLDYAKGNPIDLAFLDIQMENMNGLELAQRLIKLQPKIKIVFVSAYPSYEKAYSSELKENYMGFCTKPYSKESLYVFISEALTLMQSRQVVNISAFGTFRVRVNGIEVDFSSGKSKELLAYLVHKNGEIVNQSEIIDALWLGKDVEHAKRLYRDACYKLRQTLAVYNADRIIDLKRCRAAIVKSSVNCDYWDFLDGKNNAKYAGEYLTEYGWSIGKQEELWECV